MSFQIKTCKRQLLSAAIAALLLPQTSTTFAQDVQAGNENATEEIVVTGIRAATKNAIDIKRNSASVVDAISATDIGKLPDATIADSLQRVPGVQITRSGGEGTSVNIRGNQNVATTLNGEQMLSAGSITTVSPNFTDIPSTMVAGMEVFKSAEAKNVVSGLAGTVNLKTNRPFLLDDGFTSIAKVEAAQGSLGKQTDGTFSGFVGYNNDDTFGVSLNVSKGSSYLADYNNGSQGGNAGLWSGWNFMATEANAFAQKNVDVDGNGKSDDTFFVFQGHQAGNRFIDRDRTGINGSIQYKVNDAFELTGDVFYTKLDEHIYQAAFVAEQAWQTVTGWATPDSGGFTAYPNITHSNGISTTQAGSFNTIQSGLWQARGVKAQSQTTATNKEALNTNLELAFDNGGAFTGKVRWMHGQAVNDSSNSTVDSTITDGSQIGDTYHPAHPATAEVQYANPWGYKGFDATSPNGTAIPNSFTQIPIHISYTGGDQHWVLPSMQVTGTDGSVVTEAFGSNLNRYSARSSNVTGTYTNADLNVFRLDGAYAFDSALFDAISSVDFGARLGVREVAKDGWLGGLLRTNEYGDVYLARWKDTTSNAPITGESYVAPLSFTALNDMGMIKGISDFHGTTGVGTVYFVDPKAMNNPLAWHEKMYGPHILAAETAQVYDIKDTTTSLYVQANLDSEIFGLPYKGNVGLRYINTEYEIVQNIVGAESSSTFNGTVYLKGPGMENPAGNTLTTTNSYSDFLPAINLALNITDDKVVRFAFTKSVGTHNTDSLGGGLSVPTTNTCKDLLPAGVVATCAVNGNQLGNPNLLPNRQYNADLSYEWYFNDSSILSLGLFWVEGLTTTKNDYVFRNDIPDSDGVVRGYDSEKGAFTGLVRINSPLSYKEKSTSQGVELGYKQSFDFLPSYWSGLGVDANFTYSPSKGSETDYYGKKSPGTANSEYQSNLALWYEKDGIQARIAHNYRSKMYMARTQSGTYQFAYYQKPTNYIDASLSYDINENMTLSLQVTNLTEEHQETYNQWESNVDTRFYNERRTTLGFQVKY